MKTKIKDLEITKECNTPLFVIPHENGWCILNSRMQKIIALEDFNTIRMLIDLSVRMQDLKFPYYFY